MTNRRRFTAAERELLNLARAIKLPRHRHRDRMRPVIVWFTPIQMAVLDHLRAILGMDRSNWVYFRMVESMHRDHGTGLMSADELDAILARVRSEEAAPQPKRLGGKRLPRPRASRTFAMTPKLSRSRK